MLACLRAGMNEMNWEVGQVLDALRAHSIEKDTLVFFTSDHGAGKTPLLFGPFSDSPPPPMVFAKTGSGQT
jgi:arylsulfatase A-like enzyme